MNEGEKNLFFFWSVVGVNQVVDFSNFKLVFRFRVTRVPIGQIKERDFPTTTHAAGAKCQEPRAKSGPTRTCQFGPCPAAQRVHVQEAAGPAS